MRLKIRKVFLALFALCAFNPSVIASPTDSKETEWELANEERDIKIYWKEEEGNPVVTVKGEGILDAPIEKVLSVLVDIPGTLQWVENLKQAQILRSESKDRFITYARFSSGVFFVKDRDFVNLNTVTYLPDGKSILLETRSIEDPLMPVKEDYVRGNVSASSMRMTPLGNDKTQFVTILNSDPKGSIPKWIVNMLVKRIPLKTFHGLKRRLSDLRKKEAEDKTKADAGSVKK